MKKIATALLIFAASLQLPALTILTGPTFTPANNAPLAGTLSLTSDRVTRVQVSVTNDNGSWQRDFYDYGTNHSLTLLGFKPNQTNNITVRVFDRTRHAYTSPTNLQFITAPLPAAMPKMILVTNNPELMEPGYTLFRVANNTTGAAYVTMVDNAGQIVWYSVLPTPSDVRQLSNGDLFFPDTSEAGFTEANMLGATVRTWTAPAGYLVDSHEDLQTDHGTILYINYTKRVITNFPTAIRSNAPLASVNANVNRVVEMSITNSTLLNSWSLIDLLDPQRVDYLTYRVAFYGTDPEHANAVIEDHRDNSLIVSLRNQDAVIKISRATGQLKWILGPPENWGPQWQQYLLTPVGSPFAWQYGQHAPMLTPQGTLLMYDDGNCRAEPFDPALPDNENYSRGVEYSIDETNMQVSQVWEYTGGNEDRLYVDEVGNATWLPQRNNVLLTFGHVTYENGLSVSSATTNASMVRIKEVTHDADPSVVFDLEIFDPTNHSPTYAGNLVYRSYRVPDLYTHPATPVTDLTFNVIGGKLVLRFTADPARSYSIESSDDLNTWTPAGVPTPDDDIGDYSYLPGANGSPPAQFYRVITQ
ncbi:MAG TPA: aryl-sulfate sulfotransferase [Verrucomicrobiae bacterium]|jgi:arylsulfate sulfotransferase|nr:aryl-sulfate sulfotransferase [Verrucomicrobiae bacterium]